MILIGVWKGMEGHQEGNGHKLEESRLCYIEQFRTVKAISGRDGRIGLDTSQTVTTPRAPGGANKGLNN